MVNQCLFGGGQTKQRVCDGTINIFDGLGDPFPHIDVRISVPKLPGFMSTCAGTTWNACRSSRSVRKYHVDFYRRVSSAIKDLTTINLNDTVHCVFLNILNWIIYLTG